MVKCFTWSFSNLKLPGFGKLGHILSTEESNYARLETPTFRDEATGGHQIQCSGFLRIQELGTDYSKLSCKDSKFWTHNIAVQLPYEVGKKYQADMWQGLFRNILYVGIGKVRKIRNILYEGLVMVAILALLIKCCVPLCFVVWVFRQDNSVLWRYFQDQIQNCTNCSAVKFRLFVLNPFYFT